MTEAPAPRPVSASRSELIRWMGVQDANAAGFVHGGVVMKTCDEAAAIAAIRHCGRSARRHGHPTTVPEVLAETPAEERRRREAELRRANRLAERDQILANRGDDSA